MLQKSILEKIIPSPIKTILRPLRNRMLKKNVEELAFWKSRLAIDNGVFKNYHYEKIMLGMAEEQNDDFFKNKIIADFGCGPRGSLVWVKDATMRIGIDVLADRYADEFTENAIAHDMVYLKSTEKVIPLPSNFIDVLFTVNAIDHVNNFALMCAEIVRVLKPGGYFIGSFNLEEPATPCEPQQLNERIIKENLLNKLTIMSYRVSKKGPKDDMYAPFFNNTLSYQTGEEGVLWVKAQKPKNE